MFYQVAKCNNKQQIGIGEITIADWLIAFGIFSTVFVLVNNSVFVLLMLI